MTDQFPRRPLLIGWKGRATVVLLAAFVVARGLGYAGPAAPEGSPSILGVIDSVAPTWAWGLVYIAAGLLIIAGTWIKPLWSSGLILWAIAQSVWLAGYVVATVNGLAPRGWVTATAIGPGLLLALALLYVGPPPKADNDQ